MLFILYEVFCVLSLDRHTSTVVTHSRSIGAAYIQIFELHQRNLWQNIHLCLCEVEICCVNCLIAVKKHCSEAASEDAGPSGLSSQECALPTYSSTQDSDSSSDSDSPAGSPALHKINKMLSSQEVSPIRKRYIHSQRYVEEKCRRLMEVVVQLISLIFYT